MYYVNYGLAAYFKEELCENYVKASPYFSLSFDEILNGEIQEEQLDCHFTYWDDNRKEVCSMYFERHFLRRPNAQNILDLLQHSLNELLPQLMIQLSMDGPGTNWKVLKLLEENCKDKKYAPLVNISSCGLHTVHGVFQTGAETTTWNFGKIMKAMWQIFHDSPARRDLYTKTCESQEYPLK